MAQSFSLLLNIAIILHLSSHILGDDLLTTNSTSNATTINKQLQIAADKLAKSVEAVKLTKKPCPSPCVCLNDETIDCSHKNLTEIISFSNVDPQSIKNLNLSYNALKFFDSALPNKMKLEFLDLSHNNLSSFQLKKSVKYLDLSHNLLANISTVTFGNDNNKSMLKKIDLSFNSFKTIPDLFFQSFSNLTELDISGNIIKNLKPESFEGLKKVEILNLSSMKLVELAPSLFHALESIKILDLSNNSFSKVPNAVLRGSSTLQSLLFNVNPIKSIDVHDLDLLSSIKHLEFNDCPRLELIGKDAFSDLKSIESLIVSRNPHLTTIDPMAFHNNTNPPYLKNLDLSFNNLSFIDQTLLEWPVNGSMTINLSQNPWHCDCGTLWLRNLSHSSPVMHCATPEKFKEMEVNLVSLDCTAKQPHQNVAMMKITLILIVLLVASLVVGIMMAIKHNSFCRRLIGREQYSSVYYTKAEFGPMDTL